MQEIKTKKLEVEEKAMFGTPENPQGITIYDRVTGEPYCSFVANAIQQVEKGECGGN